MTEFKMLPFRQWAVVVQTEKATVVCALSGYRRHVFEDEPRSTYLGPNPTEEDLGRAFLESLNTSRFVDPRNFDNDFFDWRRIAAADKRWHQEFMKHVGYKTLRQAYENMIQCIAKRTEGMISIKPFLRDRQPRYWIDLPPEKTVVILATDDHALLGAALKLALSRCEPRPETEAVYRADDRA
jgi:hypothetical protein